MLFFLSLLLLCQHASAGLKLTPEEKRAQNACTHGGSTCEKCFAALGNSYTEETKCGWFFSAKKGWSCRTKPALDWYVANDKLNGEPVYYDECPAPRQCVPCDCQEWDGENYSDCEPVNENHKCGRFCVQCEDDGVTPMPGGWTTHKSACKDYTKFTNVKVEPEEPEQEEDEEELPICQCASEWNADEDFCQEEFGVIKGCPVESCNFDGSPRWCVLAENPCRHAEGRDDIVYLQDDYMECDDNTPVFGGKSNCEDNIETVKEWGYDSCAEIISGFSDACKYPEVESACCKSCREIEVATGNRHFRRARHSRGEDSAHDESGEDFNWENDHDLDDGAAVGSTESSATNLLNVVALCILFGGVGYAFARYQTKNGYEQMNIEMA